MSLQQQQQHILQLQQQQEQQHQPQLFDESPISDTKMDISETTTTTSQESPPILSPDATDQPSPPPQPPSRSSQSQIANENDLRNIQQKTNDSSSSSSSSSLKKMLLLSENSTIDDNNTLAMMMNNTTSTTNTTTTTTMTNKLTTNKIPKTITQTITDTLDNQWTMDNIKEKKNSKNSPSSNAYNLTSIRSALTLVNNHPLMSPTLRNNDEDDDCDDEYDNEYSNNCSYDYHRSNNQTKNLNRSTRNYPDLVPECAPLRLTQSCNIKSNNSNHSNEQTMSSNSFIGSENKLNINSIDFLSRKDDNNIENDDDEKSEPDVSQYHALVTPYFESVALVVNPAATISSCAISNYSDNSALPSTKLTTSNTASGIDKQKQQQQQQHQQRKSKLNISNSDLQLSDDISSFDSLSNQSFDDEDIENNLISASVSSSVFDDTGFNNAAKNNEDLCSEAVILPLDKPSTKTTAASGGSGVGESSRKNRPQQIPQYTASEESRDSRNWQKITLPDGRTREIDMKVIEPYKRVLSHGGYLSSGGHNAVVVFSACYLPDRSRTDYHYVMDNLFLYVVKTLDQLITDDYVLVYLHGGSTRGNVPPLPWLKKCYQLLNRRLRKSLKNLYMVHPTFWLKSLVWMSRPFISSKFWRKLIYVRTLNELYHFVPVERAAVPDKVKKYDLKYT